MNPNRIEHLVKAREEEKGQYILYWMQQSQRIEYNHALSFAINRANKNNLPLLVYFGLTDNFPEANERHYTFMLEGLKEVKAKFEKMGIGFVIKICSPEEGIISLIGQAKEVILDRGYTTIQRSWRQKVTDYVSEKSKNIYMLESDLIIPIEMASKKLEYSARTIRPKLMKIFEEYLDEVNIDTVNVKFKIELNEASVDISNPEELLKSFNIDHSVRKSNYLKGGETEAKKRLEDFLLNRFENYKNSNSPATNYCSELSPYLHFGQISPVYIAKEVIKYYRQNMDIESYKNYIEQLVVRRELAFNYIFYNEAYDKFEGMTDAWAYETMRVHEADVRPINYDLEMLEACTTHDPYWNAAMEEMKKAGYMHNYMRMYWAKKIIEWTANYKEAYNTIMYLNNKYFIDGRDANSYTGIAWCFGKHDRAWTERKIFGKLRYMNDKGLERKFEMRKYIKRVEELD